MRKKKKPEKRSHKYIKARFNKRSSKIKNDHESEKQTHVHGEKEKDKDERKRQNEFLSCERKRRKSKQQFSPIARRKEIDATPAGKHTPKRREKIANGERIIYKRDITNSQ